MHLRSPVFATCGVALVTLLGTLADAAAPDLASLSGMTCKGFFASPVATLGPHKVRFDMSTDGSPTAHFWRKWGKEAVANAKLVQRDADYEDRGTVAFSVKGGKIVFSNTNMGTTFHWELTPKGAPGAFLIEVTGGTFGVEGSLDCAR